MIENRRTEKTNRDGAVSVAGLHRRVTVDAGFQFGVVVGARTAVVDASVVGSEEELLPVELATAEMRGRASALVDSC